MGSSITSFVRSQVSPAGAYRLASREIHPDSIFLNLNESPYPLSPRAQDVIRNFSTGNRYPDFTQGPLRAAIGEYVGFPGQQITVGAGLDDVFAILATLFVDLGKDVVISDPTFGVYSTFYPLHGANVVNVPLGPAPDFRLDVDGVIEAVTANTAFVMICNPNNPTGTLFPLEEVERVAKSVDCPVVIDEAYAEFSGIDHLDIARRNQNVIILRTLSKFAGLAGIRVGYAIFPEDMAPYANAAMPAFGNISALSAQIAIASLADLDYLSANRDEQVAERERVTSLLNELPGVTAYPSATNFILFNVPGDDSSLIEKSLADQHIYVRRYGQPEWGLGSHLRVSVGLEHENTAFLSAFEQLLKSGVSG